MLQNLKNQMPGKAAVEAMIMPTATEEYIQ